MRILTPKDVNLKAYIDDKPAAGEYKHVKTVDPRYKRLPRFLMRWERFRIEGEQHFFELKETPPQNSRVMIVYEIEGWGETPLVEFDAIAFRPAETEAAE